jgi:hypothetical protein
VSADRPQHVRFWLVLEKGADAGPAWLGSASFDSGVTLSRDAGQVAHKISLNIDGERDRLMGDLNQTRMVTHTMKGIGPTLMAGMAKAIPISPTGKYGWHGSCDGGRRPTRRPGYSRRPR